MREVEPGRAGLAGVLLLFLALSGCREPGAGLELEARPAPDIQARAVDGELFRLGDYRGRVVLLTFGYTSCPDVCPLTLSRLKAVLSRLGPRADEVMPVFVSVDPERDTPERLHAYLTAFDRRLRGLSLAQPALQPLLDAYGVTATRRVADARRYRNHPLAEEAYSIDHTAGFFVVDKRGQLRLHFPHEASAEQMAPELVRLLEEEGAP